MKIEILGLSWWREAVNNMKATINTQQTNQQLRHVTPTSMQLHIASGITSSLFVSVSLSVLPKKTHACLCFWSTPSERLNVPLFLLVLLIFGCRNSSDLWHLSPVINISCLYPSHLANIICSLKWESSLKTGVLSVSLLFAPLHCQPSNLNNFTIFISPHPGPSPLSPYYRWNE